MAFTSHSLLLKSIWIGAYNHLPPVVSVVTEPVLISMHYQLTNLIAGRLIRSSVIGAELRRNTEWKIIIHTWQWPLSHSLALSLSLSGSLSLTVSLCLSLCVSLPLSIAIALSLSLSLSLLLFLSLFYHSHTDTHTHTLSHTQQPLPNLLLLPTGVITVCIWHRVDWE